MARRAAPARTPSTPATDDAPWLDTDEQQVYLALASVLVHLPKSLDAQLSRNAGVSHYEYLVMAALSMAPGRTLRMSQIAEFTDSTLSRLSNVATRLEKRGWISRSPDPDNGRYTLATLTDAGTATVVASAPGHVREVRRIVFDPLTAIQQRQLLEICRRILGAIDPDGRPEDRVEAITRERS
jgi:DNA-binding MarR family transcriptional regulator